jgi:hypothetical protein
MLYPWASGLAAGNYTVCLRGTNDAAMGITTNTFNYVLSLRAGM